MSFGKWEGLTNLEIEKNYPDDFKTWRESPHIANIPEGETIETAQRRIVDFVNSKILGSKYHTSLIVSHGTIIRLFLLYILSMDLKHYYKLKQSNCSINLIEFKDHGPVLIKYNDTCHMNIIK